jgi:cysteinyl-tRNA synthetase
MNDDFNTTVAVAVLFELENRVNSERDAVVAAALARQLKALAAVLGLLRREPRAFLQDVQGRAGEAGLAVADIEAKIAARVAAKQSKNYAEADRIRAELLEAGIALEDKPGGSTEWRRV